MEVDRNATLGAKLKFLAIAGVGFFADGYLNISIGLGKLQETKNQWHKPTWSALQWGRIR